MNMIRSLVRGSTSIFPSVRQVSFQQPAIITPFSAYTRLFSNSLIHHAPPQPKTKANVQDLETFFKAIGRNTVEHLELFDGSLPKFLKASSAEMKEMGIETRTRRYMIRWRYKFENDL
ncbi:uncharacterized protein SPAPADRAFT_57717, partial [Spathaspora passalidarum NRRL Y-27907]